MNINEKILEFGAFKTGEVLVKDIIFDVAFRDACARNACGKYGKCWTCPPGIGDINDVINKVKAFNKAIVYQTVGEIEDSYDFEGMMDIGDRHNAMDLKIREFMLENYDKNDFLHLGAGGCRICKKCAKLDEEPCRFPDKAMSSLEAHGIAVSTLAETANMKYINGQNTVTYFGAVFLK